MVNVSPPYRTIYFYLALSLSLLLMVNDASRLLSSSLFRSFVASARLLSSTHDPFKSFRNPRRVSTASCLESSEEAAPCPCSKWKHSTASHERHVCRHDGDVGDVGPWLLRCEEDDRAGDPVQEQSQVGSSLSLDGRAQLVNREGGFHEHVTARLTLSFLNISV